MILNIDIIISDSHNRRVCTAEYCSNRRATTEFGGVAGLESGVQRRGGAIVVGPM